MLQFLQPIWLWAISGIIVPIIIHLWNIKQGKVLKVGSIAFLQNSSKQYAKSFKVNEWLFLLLRCLLIILASFLLAKPTWQKLETTKEKGWLLINKEGFEEAYNTYKPIIDSLTNNGFAFHYFDENFTTITLAEAIKDTSTFNNPAINYWHLIQKLDTIVTTSLPIYLITDNKLIHYKGERPNIQNNIRWLTYLSKDSIAKQIAKAYLTIDDSIRIIVTNSSPTSNYFTYETLAAKTQTNTDYTTSITNGKLGIKYKTAAIFDVDTTTINITIYAAQNSNDATYLKAAINAIQYFTKQKIQIRSIKDASPIIPKEDWLFWLSDQPLPQNINSKNIFAYANGKEENTNSWINTLASNTDNNNIHLFKRIKPATNSATAINIWQDGFGHPILSKETTKQSNIYRFYNRFNPAWNNLVWENSFVTLLAAVMLDEDTLMKLDDKRIIDNQQLQPVSITSFNQKNTSAKKNGIDITNIFWISLFIVFFIERIISFRTKKADA